MVDDRREMKDATSLIHHRPIQSTAAAADMRRVSEVELLCHHSANQLPPLDGRIIGYRTGSAPAARVHDTGHCQQQQQQSKNLNIFIDLNNNNNNNKNNIHNLCWHEKKYDSIAMKMTI